MQIDVYPMRADGDLDIVSGRISWEDSDKPVREIYAAAPSGIFVNPRTAHWLLLSVINFAIREHERRIKVLGDVDPALLRGLRYIQLQHGIWYGDGSIEIDAPLRSAYSYGPEQRRTAVFFSGGVDSFATIVRNRQDFPSGHPMAIDDGILVDWFAPPSSDDLHGSLAHPHARRVNSLQTLENELGIRVVPVITNARRVARYDFYYNWMFRDQGANLSSIAHLLSGRIGRAFIASTYNLPTLAPLGSHPLTDPWYSSADLQIAHDSPDYSRLTKLRLLANRPAILAVLDVCSYWFQRTENHQLNCGKCEKCLRTQAGLAALGVDGTRITTFEPVDLLSAINGLGDFDDAYARECWAELIGPLADRGHHSLAIAVRGLVTRSRVRNPVLDKDPGSGPGRRQAADAGGVL
ncbi:MAG TPA: hypothetical protein VN714_00945 [Trebonia sp.]|nr:hypothetical protein [Trebonia sp.]